MNKERTAAAAALAAMLLVGVAVGISVDRALLARPRPFGPRAMGVLLGRSLVPEWARLRGVVRDELELTPAQMVAVDTIMLRRIAAIDSVRAAIRPDIARLVAETGREVQAALTPAQRERLDVLRSRLRLSIDSVTAARP